MSENIRNSSQNEDSFQEQEEQSQELIEKQTYLRANILEKGYDADEFMKYLHSIKGENYLDLNVWEMEELVEAVRNFVKYKSNGCNNESRINNSNNNNNDNNDITCSNLNNIKENNEGINENLNVESNEEYNKNLKEKEGKDPNINLPKIIQANKSDNNPENSDDFIHCKITEKTPLSSIKPINISVSLPVKVDGGLFSRSYVTYLVECEELKSKVRRRYSDFIWLRNYLTLHYVNCIIPPICKKKYNSRFEEEFIQKRSRKLEKFLNGVAAHPLLKQSQTLYDFLTVFSDEKLSLKKNIYDKQPAPEKISEIISKNKYVDVSISSKKETFFENIKDNSVYNKEQMSKIKRESKNLIESVQVSIEKMKELAVLWNNLYTTSRRYYENSNTYETYAMMSKFMEDWARVQSRQIDLLALRINEFFSFIKKEFDCITE